MTSRHRKFLLSLMLASAFAGGCGKREENSVATQVAAKINSDEITIHQVNAVLARTPGLVPDVAPRVKQEILSRLIDQQLSVQQAIRRKLDRSPTVVQAMEAARLEILSRAYAEDVGRTLPKPTADEVTKYYAEHPELFAQRRVYTLEDISVAPKEGLVGALREQISRAKSMQEIASWLKSQGAEFNESRSERSAEQLPLDVVGRLLTTKAGEVLLIESGGSLNVIQVLAAKSAPVDEATASPRIQQFLFNRRLSQAILKEMEQIRGAAKIQYFGEFADSSAADHMKSGGKTEPAQRPVPAAPAPAPKTGG